MSGREVVGSNPEDVRKYGRGRQHFYDYVLQSDNTIRQIGFMARIKRRENAHSGCRRALQSSFEQLPALHVKIVNLPDFLSKYALGDPRHHPPPLRGVNGNVATAIKYLCSDPKRFANTRYRDVSKAFNSHVYPFTNSLSLCGIVSVQHHVDIADGHRGTDGTRREVSSRPAKARTHIH